MNNPKVLEAFLAQPIHEMQHMAQVSAFELTF